MGVSVTSSLKIRRRRLEFLTSSVWTPSPGVTQVILTIVGAGASGGAGDWRNPACGGGAGGTQLVAVPVSVTPGVTVPVVVGSGGAPVTAYYTGEHAVGQAGGDSAFGSLTAPGGQSVRAQHHSAGSGANFVADATKGSQGRSAGGGGYRIRSAGLRGTAIGGDSFAGRGVYVNSPGASSTTTATSARPNSGAGGGAAWLDAQGGTNGTVISGAGGSGIVIIEWEERS